MKKLLSLAVLASTMTLTACGGDSDSSGSNSVSSTFTKTLSNGNVYSCPTQSSFDACGSDSTCKATNCTATKIVTPIVDPTTLAACEVSGTNIYGTKGKSCTFAISGLNGGATQTLTCNTSGGGTTNNITFGTSFNLNGMALSCK